jgi:N-acetylmuramoyl-L-alanine amidase
MLWIRPSGRLRILPALLLSPSLAGVFLPLLVASSPAHAQRPSASPAGTPGIPPSAAGSGPAAPNVAPRFLVVLDPAHGGSDTGARIAPGILEKDITLNLAGWLRSILSAHGITVITTRDTSDSVSAVTRAQKANRLPAAACLLLHATATGSGVHLYTSSLAPTQMSRFMPWQSVQSGYVTRSLKLSSEIDSALAHAEIPVTIGRTALEPMDSFACPAVAIEIAPLQAGAAVKGRPLTDLEYQRAILDAVTAALDEWHNDWKQQP